MQLPGNLLPLVFLTGLLAGCAQQPGYVVESPNAPPLSRDEAARRSVDAQRALAAYQQVLTTIDVRDADSKLEVISMSPPDYPEEAQSRGIEGVVRVRFVIGRDGRAEDISLVQQAHPMLNAAAVNAVKKWRFKPMTQQGRPVRVSVEQKIPFILTP